MNRPVLVFRALTASHLCAYPEYTVVVFADRKHIIMAEAVGIHRIVQEARKPPTWLDPVC